MDLSNPLQVVAGTLWGEARGFGVGGMRDVAAVILNRASHPRWWGNDVLSVCLEPYQFSCWNRSDANRSKIQAVGAADPAFASALAVASEALSNASVDQTGGADSYFALSMPSQPAWARRAVHTCDRYGHSFWRVELPFPGSPTATRPNGVPASPNFSTYSVASGDPDTSADALNAAELASNGDPS